MLGWASPLPCCSSWSASRWASSTGCAASARADSTGTSAATRWDGLAALLKLAHHVIITPPLLIKRARESGTFANPTIYYIPILLCFFNFFKWIRPGTFMLHTDWSLTLLLVKTFLLIFFFRSKKPFFVEDFFRIRNMYICSKSRAIAYA